MSKNAREGGQIANVADTSQAGSGLSLTIPPYPPEGSNLGASTIPPPQTQGTPPYYTPQETEILLRGVGLGDPYA